MSGSVHFSLSLASAIVTRVTAFSTPPPLFSTPPPFSLLRPLVPLQPRTAHVDVRHFAQASTNWAICFCFKYWSLSNKVFLKIKSLKKKKKNWAIACGFVACRSGERNGVCTDYDELRGVQWIKRLYPFSLQLSGYKAGCKGLLHTCCLLYVDCFWSGPFSIQIQFSWTDSGYICFGLNYAVQ